MPDEIDWECPHCRGKLKTGWQRWNCLGCGAEFRAIRGIGDLRTAEDLYLPNAEDWSLARTLDAEYDRRDFRGLLDLYYSLCDELTHELKQRQISHILTAPGRVGRWVDALRPLADGPLLDLGCGSGSFLAAVGRSVPSACGIDIAMRWLILARKRLDEEGLSRVGLACACAEALPIPDDSLGGVVAGDVIEHVGDQPATLAETYRVLRPGGRVFLASPNRYSLAPEPHVQVWGVGFLPRRWMAAYVWWRRKADFRAIRTLGYAEWVRTLNESPFGGGRVTAPPLPSDDFTDFGPLKRAAGRLYNAVVASRLGQRLALMVGPLFHVVCEKGGSAPHSSSRATRPHSRPIGVRA